VENLHQVLVRALDFKLLVIGADIEGAPASPAADHHLLHHLHLHHRHAHVVRIAGRQIAEHKRILARTSELGFAVAVAATPHGWERQWILFIIIIFMFLPSFLKDHNFFVNSFKF
jgi:hypothetical protein